MTQSEFAAFFVQARIAFPGLSEWVLEKSPDAQATFAVWAKTLARTDIEDATAALDGWVTGSIPNPPIGYRRESFALDVRAIAAARADARHKVAYREETLNKSRRKDYKPSAAFISIAKPFSLILDSQRRMMNGEITMTEHDRVTAEIIEEAFERVS